MKFKKAHIIILLVLLSACKKESFPGSDSFVKVVQSDEEFVASKAFQQAEGNYIQLGVAHETPSESVGFGTHRSNLVSYSEEGDIIWQKSLPGNVHRAMDMLELPNGDIFVCGYDSLFQSPNVGLVKLSKNGDLLTTNAFFNSMPVFNEGNLDTDFNYMTATLLSSGEVAIALIGRSTIPLTAAYVLRIVIVNQNLQVVRSSLFDGSDDHNPVRIRSSYCRISEAPNGDLVFPGSVAISIDESSFAAVIKINPGTFKLSDEPDTLHFPIQSYYNFVNTGWGYSLASIDSADYALLSNYKIRNGRVIYTGPAASVYSKSNTQEFATKLRGLPSSVGVVDIQSLSDGGLIILGIANMLLQENLVSDAIPFLARVNHSGQLQFTRILHTGSPTYPESIREVENGFVISATALSLDNKFQLTLIKTDINGNLN